MVIFMIKTVTFESHTKKLILLINLFINVLNYSCILSIVLLLSVSVGGVKSISCWQYNNFQSLVNIDYN